jgi:hypothetical protein
MQRALDLGAYKIVPFFSQRRPLEDSTIQPQTPWGVARVSSLIELVEARVLLGAMEHQIVVIEAPSALLAPVDSNDLFRNHSKHSRTGLAGRDAISPSSSSWHQAAANVVPTVTDPRLERHDRDRVRQDPGGHPVPCHNPLPEGETLGKRRIGGNPDHGAPGRGGRGPRRGSARSLLGQQFFEPRDYGRCFQ